MARKTKQNNNKGKTLPCDTKTPECNLQNQKDDDLEPGHGSKVTGEINIQDPTILTQQNSLGDESEDDFGPEHGRKALYKTSIAPWQHRLRNRQDIESKPEQDRKLTCKVCSKVFMFVSSCTMHEQTHVTHTSPNRHEKVNQKERKVHKIKGSSVKGDLLAMTIRHKQLKCDAVMTPNQAIVVKIPVLSKNSNREQCVTKTTILKQKKINTTAMSHNVPLDSKTSTLTKISNRGKSAAKTIRPARNPISLKNTNKKQSQLFKTIREKQKAIETLLPMSARIKPNTKNKYMSNRKVTPFLQNKEGKKSACVSDNICSYCNKKFSSRTSCNRHVRLHTNDKPYHCTFCTEAFSNGTYLKRHTVKVHGLSILTRKRGNSVEQHAQLPDDVEKRPADQKIPGKLKASKGRKTKNSKRARKNIEDKAKCAHNAILSNEKSQNPKLSGYKLVARAKTSSVLVGDQELQEDSIKINNENDVAKINNVNSCVNNALWVTHQNTHNAKLPYKCTICFQSFTAKKYLNSHNASVHGIDILVCQYCKKQFSKVYNRVIHERLHTNERPYGCTYCDQAYPSAKYLQRHVKKIHPDKVYSGWRVCSQRDIELQMKEENVTKKQRMVNTVVNKEKGHRKVAIVHQLDQHASITNIEEHTKHGNKDNAHKDYQAVKKKAEHNIRKPKRSKQIHSDSFPDAHRMTDSASCNPNNQMVNQKALIKPKTHSLKECQTCQQEFPSQRTLDSHESALHGRDPRVCQCCPRRFINTYVRATHEKRHAKKKQNVPLKTKPDIVTHEKVCAKKKEHFPLKTKPDIATHEKRHAKKKQHFPLKTKPEITAHEKRHAKKKQHFPLKTKPDIKHHAQYSAIIPRKQTTKSQKNYRKLHPKTSSLKTKVDDKLAQRSASIQQTSPSYKMHTKLHTKKTKSLSRPAINSKVDVNVKQHSLNAQRETLTTSSKCPMQSRTTVPQIRTSYRRRSRGSCSYCGKTFTRVDNARVHERTVHLKLRPYKCVLCDAKFARPEYLNQHSKNVHKKMIAKVKPEYMPLDTNETMSETVKQQTGFNQTPASKTNGQKTDAFKGLGNKTSTKTFARSPRCSKSDVAPNKSHGIKASSTEIAHNNTGSRKTKHGACSYCGKAFTRVGNVRIHERAVHLKLKPYKCVWCKEQFARPEYLNKHSKTVHHQLSPPTSKPTRLSDTNDLIKSGAFNRQMIPLEISLTRINNGKSGDKDGTGKTSQSHSSQPLQKSITEGIDSSNQPLHDNCIAHGIDPCETDKPKSGLIVVLKYSNDEWKVAADAMKAKSNHFQSDQMTKGSGKTMPLVDSIDVSYSKKFDHRKPAKSKSSVLKKRMVTRLHQKNRGKSTDAPLNITQDEVEKDLTQERAQKDPAKYAVQMKAHGSAHKDIAKHVLVQKNLTQDVVKKDPTKDIMQQDCSQEEMIASATAGKKILQSYSSSKSRDCAPHQYEGAECVTMTTSAGNNFTHYVGSEEDNSCKSQEKRPSSRSWNCEECPAVFSCSKALVYHKRSCQNDNGDAAVGADGMSVVLQVVSDDDDEVYCTPAGLFTCKHCPAIFTKKRQFKSHQFTHLSHSQFGCPQCGKVFTRHQDWRSHMIAAHSHLQSYLCKYCSKRFRVIKNWWIHEEMHEMLT